MRIRLKLLLLLGLVLVSAAARADESGLVAIYPYATGSIPLPPSEMKPIVLQVPEAFRYGGSKGVSRAYGINILTFYPSFTSPRAPENARFVGGCKGDCNGRILIDIENDSRDIHSPDKYGWGDYPNMGDAIAHRTLEHPLVPNGARVTHLGPQHGFDSGLQIDASSPSLGGWIHRYLFHLSPDRVHYDLAVDCNINEFAKACSLHFSLKCNPAIYIWMGALQMTRIDQFLDVKQKTDRFVTSMVRKPACV